jgi:hypothetical protein
MDVGNEMHEVGIGLDVDTAIRILEQPANASVRFVDGFGIRVE